MGSDTARFLAWNATLANGWAKQRLSDLQRLGDTRSSESPGPHGSRGRPAPLPGDSATNRDSLIQPDYDFSRWLSKMEDIEEVDSRKYKRKRREGWVSDRKLEQLCRALGPWTNKIRGRGL